jgi:hypothetical protein
MVIEQPHDEESIFDVFATRARRRSTTSLVSQTAASTVTGVFLALLDPSWWPVVAGLAAGACYATWGLLDRQARSRFTAPALRAVAVMAALLVITAVIGVGLAAFTGEGRSPYGTCYDANGRAFACDAHGQRRS